VSALTVSYWRRVGWTSHSAGCGERRSLRRRIAFLECPPADGSLRDVPNPSTLPKFASRDRMRARFSRAERAESSAACSDVVSRMRTISFELPEGRSTAPRSRARQPPNCSNSTCPLQGVLAPPTKGVLSLHSTHIPIRIGPVCEPGTAAFGRLELSLKNLIAPRPESVANRVCGSCLYGCNRAQGYGTLS
jgi:hypothetical protein